MPYKDVDKQRAAQHEWYLKNKAQVKEANRGYRRKLKEEVRALKESGQCADCGKQYPHFVMEYDHLPGSEKVAVISKMANTHSRLRVLQEIAKCDLVCANCHRYRTFQRSNP